MTERKPANMTFESWVERQIRTAEERGEFDDLPGSGKPLPKNFDDEMWWVRKRIEEEGLSTEAVLPTPLQLRKETERLADTVRDLPTERAVRHVVDDLNKRIVDWLRTPSGPRVPLRVVDADDIVAQWRGRPERAVAEPLIDEGPSPAPTPQPGSWWRRLIGRNRRTR